MKRINIKKASIVIIAIICILIFGLLFSTEYRPWDSPARSLQKFYEYGQDPRDAVAEDMLMDPLILAGKKVVPLVIQEAKSKEMPKRGYAISFLKNGAYIEALPLFVQILEDEQENVHSRSDALRAIYLIDKTAAKDHIAKYQDRDGPLGQMANCLRENDPQFTNIDKRSFWEAFWGTHH